MYAYCIVNNTIDIVQLPYCICIIEVTWHVNTDISILCTQYTMSAKFDRSFLSMNGLF